MCFLFCDLSVPTFILMACSNTVMDEDDREIGMAWDIRLDRKLKPNQRYLY